MPPAATAVLDERPARVVGVGEVPLDEERQTLAEGGIVGHQVPVELHPVRTRAAHRQRLVPGSPRHGVEVVGPQAQRRLAPSPVSVSRRCTHEPTGLVTASSRSTTAISSM